MASKQLRIFLEANPYCCFCGGEVRAETRDHVPSTQMFDLRQRPKGLEIPACRECNNNTGEYEQVAALLARFDAEPATNRLRKELESLMRGVVRHNSLLMSELVGTSWVQDYDAASKLGADRSVLNVSGPLIRESMHCFGAKLTFALHYNSTGRIVPKTCSLGIRWYTNWDRMLDRVPQNMFELVGGPSTLQQGKLSVRNRFEYMHAAIPGRDVGLYVAAFDKAYLIVGFVLDSPENLLDIADPGQVFQPGCFRNSS